MTDQIFSSVFPIAPVSFNDDESLNHDDIVRVPDYLVDQNVEGILALWLFVGPVSYTHLTLPTIYSV